MQSIIVFLAIATLAFAAPQLNRFRPQQQFIQPQQRIPIGNQADPKSAVILRYDSDNIGIDGYKYSVETSDGQAKQEEGQLINAGRENESIAVKGQFSYTGPDGVVYTVTYIADENGFQPQGAHLPASQ